MVAVVVFSLTVKSYVKWYGWRYMRRCACWTSLSDALHLQMRYSCFSAGRSTKNNCEQRTICTSSTINIYFCDFVTRGVICVFSCCYFWPTVPNISQWAKRVGKESRREGGKTNHVNTSLPFLQTLLLPSVHILQVLSLNANKKKNNIKMAANFSTFCHHVVSC